MYTKLLVIPNKSSMTLHFRLGNAYECPLSLQNPPSYPVERLCMEGSKTLKMCWHARKWP